MHWERFKRQASLPWQVPVQALQWSPPPPLPLAVEQQRPASEDQGSLWLAPSAVRPCICERRLWRDFLALMDHLEQLWRAMLALSVMI